MGMTSLGTYKSSVVKDKSFRTTIPIPVAKALGLEHRSRIVWEVFVEEGRVKAVVRKLEEP